MCFVVVAVLVTRVRPAGLLCVWLQTCMPAVAGALLSRCSVPTVEEILFIVGPTGCWRGA